ncbi:hypothetical protein AGMMS49936_11240 [Endomicrobiia bacterium]|nr:hypothetical protein AGMMS49936_11240 [Endomicrobiia bacterium]
MLKIEKEDFGENIERIVYENNHYYYRGHDNGWTRKNCGLYAMKRMLFVLGKHNEIDKNLWYKYTDSQLREMLLETPGHERAANQNTLILCSDLKTLMEDLSVPADHRELYGKTGLALGGNTISESVQLAVILHENARQDLERYSNDGTRRLSYPGENIEVRTKQLEGREKEAREYVELCRRIEREHRKKMNRLLNR